MDAQYRGDPPIERTLFSFIWTHSKWAQIRLLLITLVLFPLLYLTLELPKRIINDAVGAGSQTVVFRGIELDQVTFLMVLCGLFFLAVLLHGLLKMRINTMKGILSERLLRRLRYTLIARILRFPAPYFERTSQGELVSMITSEAEPMGGLMGDALAQPVLQAGQMLTILGFLFAQSFVFGLTACALIPVQAWIIPRMQRQINALNKKRVIEVRALAAEIGETAAGAATLRMNGGWRYRMALISARLGQLYAIRFELFRKKFFMKFTNNFIGQLTPLFLYAVGGYLAIRGDITVGALVAALAAYKDLSSPWKELLTYYNQTQDMATRWDTITDRFAPDGVIDAALMEGTPAQVPRIAGDIVLRDVTVQDADGAAVLEDLDATFPAGSIVAISAISEEDRRALVKLLTREVLPAAGTVTLGGHDIRTLHQTTIARRIGYASSAPVTFRGKLGENVNMALRTAPQDMLADTELTEESARTGNSTDSADAEWLDVRAADVADIEELQQWWITLIRGTGLASTLFARAIELEMNPAAHPDLARAIVGLRAQIIQSVRDAGLEDSVQFFDRDTYNPALPVAENLLHAMPLLPITAQVLVDRPSFLQLLGTLDLERDLLQLAADIVELLRQIFGVDGTDHPLFRKLGLDPDAFEAALSHVPAHRRGAPLDLRAKAELLAVPLVVPAAKIGAAFPDDIVARILDIRHVHAAALLDSARDLFEPLSMDAPITQASVLENAVFGKVASGADADALAALVGMTLRSAGLEGALLHQLFDLPVGLGGANLPAKLTEPLALCRATVKKPDILILDRPLASFDGTLRDTLHSRLRTVLPDTTIIALAPEIAAPETFDHRFEMQQGRLSNVAEPQAQTGDQTVSADLARKLRALERTDLFSGLDRKQLRLLAFGARWYGARAGDYVFHAGDDPSSGAFLILEGTADLLHSDQDGTEKLITTSHPGDLVGELGLIRDVPRALDMRAATDLACLRIGADEFVDVVRHDPSTAYKLLQVVAGYI